jgi:putative serine protease PepD
VLVVDVEPGTPAASAGIAAGDQIVAVAGTTVSTQHELTAALSAKHPGDTITVAWRRTPSTRPRSGWRPDQPPDRQARR